MRPDAVARIKAYLRTKPDYKLDLETVKNNVLLTGGTEEEFQAAVVQLEHEQRDDTLPRPPSDPLPSNKKSRFDISKKLVEVNIATNVVTTVLILFSLVFFSTLWMNKQVTTQPVTTHSEASGLLAAPVYTTQVYANAIPVNPSQVFSYPANKVSLAVSGTPKKEVLGFFPYWMLDGADQVNFTGLTDVSLFGVETDGNGNILTTASDGTPDPGWKMWNDPKLQGLVTKLHQKGIKVALTIKAFDNTHIEQLVNSDLAQKQFIANALQLVNTNALNGINVDFEYVGSPSDTTRNAFTRFITNLYAALKRQDGQATLTVDTYITAASVPQLVDIPAVASNVDAFVVMGYDIHTPKGSPGPIAPLDGPDGIIGYMQSYLEKVPAEKLILAVPYYGYDWPKDTNSSDTAKMLPYAQIQSVTRNSVISWDAVAQTPWYTYTDPQSHAQHVVYFENTRSLGIKYDFVNKKDLKGIGIWALGYEGLNNDLAALIINKFAH